MSQPMVIPVMMSPSTPLPRRPSSTASALGLPPSALRRVATTTTGASATAAERSNKSTVTFSSQHQPIIDELTSTADSSDQEETTTTTGAAASVTPNTAAAHHPSTPNNNKNKPQHCQHHVQTMLLKLQRQAEITQKLDQRVAATAARDEGDIDESSSSSFPRIPTSADDLDDDDDEVNSLTSDDRSSSSSCSGDATDEEEENRLVQQLVQYAFHQRKRKSIPSIISTTTNDTASVASSSSTSHVDTTSSKRQRVSDGGAPSAAGAVTVAVVPIVPCPNEVATDAFYTYVRHASSNSHDQQKKGRMCFSLSAPNLVIRGAASSSGGGKSISPTLQAAPKNAPQASQATALTSPQDYLRQMHADAGLDMKLHSATSIPDFFVKGDADQYDMTIVQAVRSGNLELLRSLKEQHNRNLQCCNKFGESIVHTVARHGLAQVLQLLLDLHVSVQVCCDSGRTPLSDACWTQVPPTMELVDRLLDACPDLLYITDRRGLAPLNYVPREHWESWCQYLDRRGIEKLRPKQLL